MCPKLREAARGGCGRSGDEYLIYGGICLTLGAETLRDSDCIRRVNDMLTSNGCWFCTSYTCKLWPITKAQANRLVVLQEIVQQEGQRVFGPYSRFVHADFWYFW